MGFGHGPTPKNVADDIASLSSKAYTAYKDDNDEAYYVWSFTSSGNLVTGIYEPVCDIMVVAGGGAGGSDVSGGGGGGGLIYSGSVTMASASTHAAVIGAGGASTPFVQTSAGFTAGHGANSSFLSRTASGGGVGGSWTSGWRHGGDGGSGGGGYNGAAGEGIEGQGHDGAGGTSLCSGGGAGEAGKVTSYHNPSSHASNTKASGSLMDLDGTYNEFAAGGVGGSDNGAGDAGGANTGTGGDGTGGLGTSGGSGIVMVRYPPKRL